MRPSLLERYLPRSWPAGSRRRTVVRLVLFAVLFVLFLVAEKDSFKDATEPRRQKDSGAFLRTSRAPLLSKEFLSGRAIATPLLYKLTDRDGWTIVRTQSLLSVVCWFGLALAVAAGLRSLAAQLAAVIGICALALSRPVNQWDYMLLSESLSFSLLALTLALTLVLGRAFASDRKARPLLTLAWAGACLVFAVTRDSNLYLLATLWGALAVWFAADRLRAFRRSNGGRPESFHRGLALALVLLASILAASHAALRYSSRWHDPLTNVLLKRVLRYPEIYELWVTRYGLPRNAAFERYAGHQAWTELTDAQSIRERFWARDPEVEDVRTWLLEDGMSSYARYLVWDRPGDSIRASFRAFGRNLSSRFVERIWGSGEGMGKRPWTMRLTRWTYKKIRRPLTAWAAVLTVAAASAVWFSAGRSLSLLSVFLAVNAWTQAFVTLHGDASNVNRHMLICGVLFRLAAILAAAVVLDQLLGLLRKGWARRRTARAGGAEPASPPPAP